MFYTLQDQYVTEIQFHKSNDLSKLNEHLFFVIFQPDQNKDIIPTITLYTLKARVMIITK